MMNGLTPNTIFILMKNSIIILCFIFCSFTANAQSIAGKAEFNFNYRHDENPKKPMFWKGEIYAKISTQ